MPSPVAPNEFCEAVPGNNTDMCVKVEKFFNVPQKLCDLFNWMLTPDGAISDAFKMEVASFLMPTGTIVPSATLNMGSAFLQCTGVAISRTTYAALFAQIGTRYGAGDASTTFNLPNLQGRSPIGAGSGSGLTFRDINNPTVGEETHTMLAAELVSHTHTFRVNANDDGGAGSGSAVPDDSDPTVSGNLTGTTNATGSAVPFNVVHPAFVTFFFIKV
jgi:microcystin-dependent protein